MRVPGFSDPAICHCIIPVIPCTRIAVLALIIDDHTLFRKGLELLLKQQDPAIEILQAGSYEEAVPLSRRAVDLIFLDYHLPGLKGLEALAALRETFDAPVIMLSGEEDPRLIRQSIELGAVGYVPKSSTPDGLAAAVKTILSGGIYLPRAAIERERVARSEATAAALDSLTRRQLQVLSRAIQGRINKEIARELGLSEGTVKSHLSAAFHRLGVQNRTEAIYLSARLGLRSLLGEA
jgi:DNA-binding NarL/FixJ family response regulator